MTQKIINTSGAQSIVALSKLDSPRIIVAVKGNNPKNMQINILTKTGNKFRWNSFYCQKSSEESEYYSFAKDAINDAIENNYNTYNCSNTIDFAMLISGLKGGLGD